MAGLTSIREVAALLMDNIQKPAKVPFCLLGVVPHPTDSRLSETKVHV